MPIDADASDPILFARTCLSAGDLSEAEASATEALEAAIAEDDHLRASRAFGLLGSVARERGEYHLALERYMKSLELSRAAGDRRREAASLNEIGEVLMDSGEGREALSYFMDAAELLKKEQDSSPDAEEISASVLLRIGQTLLELGEPENAAGYLELALDAAERLEDATLRSRAYASLSAVERRRGNSLEARKLISLAHRTATGSGQTLSLAEILLESALLHLDSGEIREALSELDSAEREASKAGLKRKLADVYRSRSVALERLGDLGAALASYRRFHELEEETAGERVARLVRSAEVRAQLESARQEAEIYRLRNVELKERRRDLELTNARLRAVSEIGREITASLDAGRIAETVYERLLSLVDLSDFCLAVHEPSKGELEFRLVMQNGERLPPFAIPSDSPDSFAAWVLAKGEPLRLDDAAMEHRRYIASDRLQFGGATSSLVYVPLFHDRKAVGVIGMQSPRVGVYNDEDVKLLSALAAYVAVALENSRIHEELARVNAALQAEKAELERLTTKISHIANHDGLTGLPNRLLLSELLEAAIGRSLRSKKAIAVMYLDLDDFKPINDSYGHMAGDIALVVVSERLKRALRSSDTVARVGGDEFVALAADIDDPQTISTVARKLVAACRRPMDVQGRECRVGVSIGIALFPNDGKTAAELLRKADEALYRMKRSGKNGFVFYGSE